jgi:hypothetical protein
METQEYTNRQFMIFNVSELNQINFTEVLETSSETVRRSVDGTKTFVKKVLILIVKSYQFWQHQNGLIQIH